MVLFSCHLPLWIYSLKIPSCVKDTWCHLRVMLYSMDNEWFLILYITAGVRLHLCLYAYDFVMSGCLFIRSVHENCYCVPRHCLQLLQNNTNKTLCGPSYSSASLPPSLFRHKHRSLLGNRCCAHSLTEISRRKTSMTPRNRGKERVREDEVFSCGLLLHLFFSSGPNYLVSDVSLISLSVIQLQWAEEVIFVLGWPWCCDEVSAGTVMLIKDDTGGTSPQSSSSALHFPSQFPTTRQGVASRSYHKFPPAAPVFHTTSPSLCFFTGSARPRLTAPHFLLGC